MTASHVHVTRGPMPVEYHDDLFSWKKYSNCTLISILCKHTAIWYQMCLYIVQCSHSVGCWLCRVMSRMIREHSQLMFPPLLLGLHCCLFRHQARPGLAWVAALVSCIPGSRHTPLLCQEQAHLTSKKRTSKKRTSTLLGVDVEVLSTVLIHRDGKERWQEKQTESEQWMLWSRPKVSNGCWGGNFKQEEDPTAIWMSWLELTYGHLTHVWFG